MLYVRWLVAFLYQCMLGLMCTRVHATAVLPGHMGATLGLGNNLAWPEEAEAGRWCQMDGCGLCLGYPYWAQTDLPCCVEK